MPSVLMPPEIMAAAQAQADRLLEDYPEADGPAVLRALCGAALGTFAGLDGVASRLADKIAERGLDLDQDFLADDDLELDTWGPDYDGDFPDHYPSESGVL